MFGRMHSSGIGKFICTIKKQVTGLVFCINLSNCSKKEYLCDIFQKFIKKNKLFIVLIYFSLLYQEVLKNVKR